MHEWFSKTLSKIWVTSHYLSSLYLVFELTYCSLEFPATNTRQALDETNSPIQDRCETCCCCRVHVTVVEVSNYVAIMLSQHCAADTAPDPANNTYSSEWERQRGWMQTATNGCVKSQYARLLLFYYFHTNTPRLPILNSLTRGAVL